MEENFKREKKWLLEEKYKGVENAEFFEDLKKLKDGTPLAYLIGNIPFLDSLIDLSFKPLIPRTETEYWVNEFLKNELKEEKSQILDIFSGSGCIGVGILKQTKNVSVDFAELDEDYIKQIEKNLELNKIKSSKYQIFKSNVFSDIPQKKYDYILANPPYISDERKDTVEDSVLENEDHDTLFAKDDGLFFIKKLIEKSKNYLVPNGKVYIEYDPWQTEKIIEFLKTNKIEKYEIIQDQYKRDRVLMFSH